jgi:DNA polymerase III subunit alpha
MAVLDKAIERAQKTQRDTDLGQHGLFGVFDDHPAAHKDNEKLPPIPEWDQAQRLAGEKEILGFFITGHPLEKYLDKLADFGARNIEDLLHMHQSTGKDELYVGGIMSGVRVAKSKRGDFYVQGTLEDTTGAINLFVFSKEYAKLGDKVKLEVPVLIRGGLMVEEGANPKLSVTEITPLEDAQPRFARALRIRIPLETATPETVDALHALCSECKGEAKILFDLERDGDFMVVMEPQGYNVQPDRLFIKKVEELCGRGAVRLID